MLKAPDERGTVFGRELRISPAQHGKPEISVADRTRYPHEIAGKQRRCA